MRYHWYYRRVEQISRAIELVVILAFLIIIAVISFYAGRWSR